MFLAKGAGQTQLMVRWLDDGSQAQITTLPNAPAGIRWSPNLKFIAFMRLVPATPQKPGEMPKKQTGANWAAPPTYRPIPCGRGSRSDR
jgi:hypothetical protein